MALHTKAEFAKLCNIPSKNLATYIGRDKVVVQDGYIDDKNPINAEFLAHRQSFLSEKTEPEANEAAANDHVIEQKEPAHVVKSPVKAKKNTVSVRAIKESAPVDSGFHSMRDRNLEKVKAQTIKLQIEADIKQLEYDKKRGDLVETEKVFRIISELGKAIISNYTDGAQSFLQEVGHKKRFTSDEQAEYKGTLVRMINRYHDTAIKDALRNLESIIEGEKQTDEEPE
jgi:hypothetical protein